MIDGFAPTGVSPDCRKIGGFHAGMAARIDPLEGRQVHRDIQADAAVVTVSAGLDAQCGISPRPPEAMGTRAGNGSKSACASIKLIANPKNMKYLAQGLNERIGV
jgi:hypothetical protein